MIRKYRRKPVVVEAVKWDGREETFWEILKLASEYSVQMETDKRLRINSRDYGGLMAMVNIGDYVVKEERIIDSYKSAYFEAHYEPMYEEGEMTRRYRKKSTEEIAEAVKWDGKEETFRVISELVSNYNRNCSKLTPDYDCSVRVALGSDKRLYFTCRYEVLIADVGDYVLLEPAALGEDIGVYPGDAFKIYYELIEEGK